MMQSDHNSTAEIIVKGASLQEPESPPGLQKIQASSDFLASPQLSVNSSMSPPTHIIC